MVGMSWKRVVGWTTVLVAAGCVLGATGAWATWGAIAVSDETGAWGVSWDHPTEAQAQVRALDECGVTDCTVEVIVHDACGAVAAGAERVGAAYADTRAEAEARAISACGSPDCDVVAWNCS